MPKRMLPALMGLLAGSVVGLTAPPAPAARANSTTYTIEGITLGDRVERSRDFRCEPGERSAEFNWCQRTRQDRGKRGPFSSTLAFLQNPSGTAVYVSRSIEPAFFGASDIESEIARLSGRFGERAREVNLPRARRPSRRYHCAVGQIETRAARPRHAVEPGHGRALPPKSAGRSSRRPEAFGAGRPAGLSPRRRCRLPVVGERQCRWPRASALPRDRSRRRGRQAQSGPGCKRAAEGDGAQRPAEEGRRTLSGGRDAQRRAGTSGAGKSPEPGDHRQHDGARQDAAGLHRADKAGQHGRARGAGSRNCGQQTPRQATRPDRSAAKPAKRRPRRPRIIAWNRWWR